MAQRDSKFSLGSQVIAYSATSPEVLEAIAKVLPAADPSIDESAIKFIDTPFDDLELALIAISDCLMAEYQGKGNLWIDAAVLIAPNGTTVLLCGASEAGKSTLTATFAEFGWKLTTEDVAIICRDGSIPPLIRPISLREGTAGRIEEQTGKPVAVLDDRWYYNESAFVERKMQMPLQVVVLIKGVKPDQPGEMSVLRSTPEQMVRELLPCSNALRIADGVDFLFANIKVSPCYLIEGGTISERMKAIEDLVG